LNVTVTVFVLDPEEMVSVAPYAFVAREPVVAETVRLRGDPLLTVPLVGRTESHPEPEE
jgi:hypothetical protein